jgi:D-alanyl-lipoteichoic acid acyltransferase DltB (MBOAT superfamily)
VRFDSFAYAVFFPIVLTLLWCAPQRLRLFVVLAASYYFYMYWRAPYALLLVLITAIDFCVGICLVRAEKPFARRLILLTSLAANLSILAFFKYYPWAVDTLQDATGKDWLPRFAFVLPIGLSFHTFQSMAYAVDVYQRKIEPERHLGRFATFIVYFPQLVSGPIERGAEMLPQLRKFANFDYERATNGLKLIAWGLFKKVVIADRLARFVDPVYARSELFSGPTLVLATLAFAYQVYCDFSGYTDIALGSAEVMGIRLRPNFRAPFHARNVQDFWMRWHISLSSWFRDYMYFPLEFRRAAASRGRGRLFSWAFWACNVLVVFLLSGAWHGANWTFVVWGLYHGLLLVGSRLTHDVWKHFGGRKIRKSRLINSLAVARTFALVTAGFVFFRAPSIRDAWLIFRHVATDWQSFLTPERISYEAVRIGWERWDTAVIVAALLALEVGDTYGQRFSWRQRLALQRAPVRWAAYYALILAIVFCGQFGGAPFIYFQF